MFPSPTGVNYYEFKSIELSEAFKEYANGFRPQQGLTIMNESIIVLVKKSRLFSFRPQQGLTIMNKK